MVEYIMVQTHHGLLYSHYEQEVPHQVSWRDSQEAWLRIKRQKSMYNMIHIYQTNNVPQDPHVYIFVHALMCGDTHTHTHTRTEVIITMLSNHSVSWVSS